MKKTAFILLLFCLQSIVFGQSLTDANALYANKKYTEAYEAYSALQNDYNSAPVYWYNRGNAAYKSSKLASAIWCYKKAIKLKPLYENAKFNLELAEKQVVDKIAVSPSKAFNSNVRNWLSVFPSGFLSVVNLIVLAFTVLFLLMYRSNQKLQWRRIGYACGVAFILTLALSLTKHYTFKNNQEGVISSGRVSIQSEPNAESTALFILHEGCSVYTLKESTANNDWIEIELSDGRQGWCTKSSLLFV